MSDRSLMPEYMRQFACVGSSCEDTCCAFWNVTIDRQTYQRYQQVEHPSLNLQFRTDLLVKKTSVRTEASYAEMKLNETTGSCCFHDKGLCSIQSQLGEAYLSPTCSTYPRIVNEVDGEQEVSATLSCPEAARLALLNPEGISFNHDPMYRNSAGIQRHASIRTEGRHVKLLEQHFWPIRTTAIGILQNRALTLDHRFMQVAVLADRMDEASRRKGGQEIGQQLLRFQQELEDGGLTRNVFPFNPQYALVFNNRLVTRIVERSLWHNGRYKQCLDECLAGIKTTESRSIDETLKGYEEIDRQFCEPFLNDHSYIMENFLVHYTYMTLFPLTGGSLFKQISYLGILYSLIRMHLTGMSAYHRGMTPELAVKLIQSFTKNFDHMSAFREMVEAQCRTEQFKLGHLSLLIMNREPEALQ